MIDTTAIRKLIFIPAVITLAVTLLRLTGELMRWSPALFSTKPGGAFALVGIAWLVPIFGIYFAVRLSATGEALSGVGPAIGYPLAGLVLLPAVGFLATKLGLSQQGPATFGLFVVFSVVGAALAHRGWPALGKTLLRYGLAARIPVAVVMLFAILGSWGTHYDAPPPGFPDMGPFAKWVLIGVVPQLTIWIWFTMTVGALFGGIAAAATGRARRPATP